MPCCTSAMHCNTSFSPASCSAGLDGGPFLLTGPGAMRARQPHTPLCSASLEAVRAKQRLKAPLRQSRLALPLLPWRHSRHPPASAAAALPAGLGLHGGGKQGVPAQRVAQAPQQIILVACPIQVHQQQLRFPCTTQQPHGRCSARAGLHAHPCTAPSSSPCCCRCHCARVHGWHEVRWSRRRHCHRPCACGGLGVACPHA